MRQVNSQRQKEEMLLENKEPARIMCHDNSLSQGVQKNLDGLKKGLKTIYRSDEGWRSLFPTVQQLNSGVQERDIKECMISYLQL